MADKYIVEFGGIRNDVDTYYEELSDILGDKLRSRKLELKLAIRRHVGLSYAYKLHVRFTQDSDVAAIYIIDNVYYIYQYTNINNEWVVWNDKNNLEIVLTPDWGYKDLLGAIALLRHGTLARFWNTTMISEKSAHELGYDRLGFSIKGVRLRDQSRMFI